MTDPAQERIAEMQYEAGMYQSLYENCQKENERLQEAKRRALMIADERSKENVRLRKALEQIRDDMLCDPKQVAEDALSVVGTPST